MKIVENFFALIDPQWGEPCVVEETIARSRYETIDKAINLPEYGMYSGCSAFPINNPIKGDWEKMKTYGFRVQQIEVYFEK